jgi:hypothetical protein
MDVLSVFSLSLEYYYETSFERSIVVTDGPSIDLCSPILMESFFAQ